MTYLPELQIVNNMKIFVLVPKITKLKGPALGLAYTAPSLICTDTRTYINVVADIARGKDITYTSYYINSNGTTYCVPFSFNTLKQGESTLKTLKILWNFLKLYAGNPMGALGLIMALANPELEGIYLNVYVKTPQGEAYLAHYLFQRKVEETLNCLKVIPENVPFVPGMNYNITFVNKCNDELELKLSLDIRYWSDIDLGWVDVKPNSTVTVRVHIPSFYSKLMREAYARDVKIDVCNNECTTVYAIPVFDYMDFFIALPQNHRVHWYQGGKEVEALVPGKALVCLNVTKVHPDIRIRATAILKVIQDRRFLPDRAVATKEITINSFDDFNVCIPFYASSGILVRGYKLVIYIGNAYYTLGRIDMAG